MRRSRKKANAPSSSVPVDSILYRASQPNCEDEYDVIVIGSGIGGLTTASLLAQRNFKVLVLEQHTICGGCCHAFKSGGYRFGTGIHYVGGVKGPGLAKSVLDSITFEDDPLQWDPLPTNFDTLVLGTPPSDARRYEFVSGGSRAQKQHLKDQFPPEDHEAIDEYYNLVHAAAKSWRNAIALKFLPLWLTKVLTRTGLYKLLDGGMHKYATMTIMDVVNSLTDNKDLRAAMCYNWGDHGCEPKKAPWILQAGLVAHYMYGAYYPRGGPGSIALKIIPTILENGGSVLANASVKEITIRQGRATGVEMKDGRHIRAKRAVISDAGMFDTLEHLLPSTLKCRNSLMDMLFGSGGGSDTKLHTSVTGMCLFVGLKGDHNEDLHLPHTQHWVYPSAGSVLNGGNVHHLSLDEALELEPKDFFLLIASPSGKDSEWKNDYTSKSTVEIITFVPSSWFQEFAPESLSTGGGTADDPGGKPGSHGTKYESAKKKLAELMWARTVEILTSVGATNLPRTLDKVDHFQIGSPLTYAHYYRRDGGTFYGTENDLERYSPVVFFERIRPEIAEISGLYLTGQDASTPGFVGAMLGGLLCASKVAGVFNPMSMLAKES
jgi:all-trans-retinol 13,14-reductase